MVADFNTILEGLAQYLLLCTISVCTGLALLRLLRLDLPLRATLLLAPVVTLVFWSCTIGVTVALRTPLSSVAPILWRVTLLLTLLLPVMILFGRKDVHSLGIVANPPKVALPAKEAVGGLRTDLWPLLVCIVLPVVVMLPLFLVGPDTYLGSVNPDGWSYVAYGSYLWQQQRGAEGGLAPLHQYGAHLSGTRFIAASTLGLFSLLRTPGDPQLGVGFFLPWGVFVFSAACGFFAWAQRLSTRTLLTYLLFAVVAGWVFNIIWANNYDNLLALGLFPALVGTILALDPRSWAWRLMLGTLGAAVLYCYPESAPFVLGGALLVFVQRCWQERSRIGAWLLTALVASVVGLALLSPFLQELYVFLRSQAAGGLSSGTRPGEGMFGGLLDLAYQPAAFWGLGGEYLLERGRMLRNLVGWGLSALAVLGIVQLVRRRNIAIAAITLLLTSAALVFVVREAYSYGAYKMIVLNWWLMALTVVMGLDLLIEVLPTRLTAWAGPAACALTVLAPLPFNNHGTRYINIASAYQELNQHDFRVLREVLPIIGNTPVLVSVDDWLANEWAVYHLRDATIKLTGYRAFMAQGHVIPLMERATPVAMESIRYILTDTRTDGTNEAAEPWKLVWEGGAYRLWEVDLSSQALLLDIENPNGVEELDGQTFFWLGGQGGAELQVLAQQPGILKVSAEFLPGPSLPESQERRLEIRTFGIYRKELTLPPGQQTLSLPVMRGENKIILRALDEPSVFKPDDPRPLVVGVKRVTLSLDTTSATIRTITNTNGLEQVDGEPYFWLGNGPTQIVVDCAIDGELVLGAWLVPGPALPNIPVRRVQIASNDQAPRVIEVEGGLRAMRVPVRAGTTTITLTTLDVPIAKATDDPRPLVLGVKGLWVGILH